jgi:hypothetical protein
MEICPALKIIYDINTINYLWSHSKVFAHDVILENIKGMNGEPIILIILLRIGNATAKINGGGD